MKTVHHDVHIFSNVGRRRVLTLCSKFGLVLLCVVKTIDIISGLKKKGLRSVGEVKQIESGMFDVVKQCSYFKQTAYTTLLLVARELELATKIQYYR